MGNREQGRVWKKGKEEELELVCKMKSKILIKNMKKEKSTNIKIKEHFWRL